MAPSKDVIGITEAELQAVANAYPYDSTGFTAELARRFSVAELEKAYAYAHYLRVKVHDHSSLWGSNTTELMWAAELAKKQRSNPHAIAEYLGEWEGRLWAERVMQWQRHLTMAAVFGVVLGLIAGLLLHRVWWQAALVGGGMFGGATWFIRRHKSDLGWLMDQSLVVVFFLPILVIVVGILVMM